MLHVPRFWNSLSVAPLEAIGRRADDLCNNERALPWDGKLVHPVSLLNPSEDQVADVEGALLDVAVVVATKLLIVASLPHYCGDPMLLEAVEVDATSLLRFTFIVMLYARRTEDDVCREDSLRTVDQEEG